jgi:glycosyltransferase involved in cell wall biosynthesis
MKIAQIAPLYESVPPKYYGGTERIVSYLTETLVKMGHEVTLYASGDSVTGARLRPMCPRSLRLDKTSVDPVADHVLMAEKIFQDSKDFDFVHSHIDYLPFPLWREMMTPCATTLHGRLDLPNLYNLYREFDDMPVISISNSQRLPLSWARWISTVYHGIPKDLYPFQEKPGKYLAFIGRISPEKSVDTAIQIAQKAGLPLKIAAKIAKPDREYYENVIKPLLNQDGIEFIGEIGDEEKKEFLGNAAALLFPIKWPEPFGLVMIEAMACGTPVIARLEGSVPEVVETGVSGYMIRTIEEGVAAVGKIDRLSRVRCRQFFEDRFTAERMAQDYVRLYEQLIAERKDSEPFRIYG